MQHAVTAMVVAYFVDFLSEKMMNRTPFDIKPLVDSIVEGEGISKQARDTVFNYIPFLSSVKFGSFPPVAEFMKDVLVAVGGSEQDAAVAQDNLYYKWPWLLMPPVAGGQTRKTLEAVEANTDIELPFIKDRTKTGAGKEKFSIDDWYEKMSSFIFGVYGTQAAQEYFDRNKPKKEKSKTKINW